MCTGNRRRGQITRLLERDGLTCLFCSKNDLKQAKTNAERRYQGILLVTDDENDKNHDMLEMFVAIGQLLALRVVVRTAMYTVKDSLEV